jgi:hypothetical protein
VEIEHTGVCGDIREGLTAEVAEESVCELGAVAGEGCAGIPGCRLGAVEIGPAIEVEVEDCEATTGLFLHALSWGGWVCGAEAGEFESDAGAFDEFQGRL